MVQSRSGYHHHCSRKSSSPSIVPNQHCCLTKQPYNDFLHIYMLVLFFFTYGKKYWVFQAILFDIISNILNKAFWSVWKRCFSPVVLKVFSQNTCSDQLYVSFNSEVWQDIYTVSFLCCFLSFCSNFFWGYYFKGCCCKTNVYNYRRYQTLMWKCSNFFKWAAFG